MRISQCPLLCSSSGRPRVFFLLSDTLSHGPPCFCLPARGRRMPVAGFWTCTSWVIMLGGGHRVVVYIRTDKKKGGNCGVFLR